MSLYIYIYISVSSVSISISSVYVHLDSREKHTPETPPRLLTGQALKAEGTSPPPPQGVFRQCGRWLEFRGGHGSRAGRTKPNPSPESECIPA